MGKDKWDAVLAPHSSFTSASLVCPAVSWASVQVHLVRDKEIIRTHRPQGTIGSDYIDEVEMRGVEPLSEGSLAGPSPSADCDLKFPHDDAHSQASAIGSFMLRTHGKAYMRSFPA